METTEVKSTEALEKRIEELEKMLVEQNEIIKSQEEYIKTSKELIKAKEENEAITEQFFIRIMERGLAEAFLKINSIANELNADKFEKRYKNLKG